MSKLWTAALVISVLFTALNRQFESTGSASLQGAGAAVEFALSTGGLICLWSGILEIMRRSGIMDALSSALSPLLRALFPRASRDSETLGALSAKRGVASSELCLLVVINTASIQLLPTTVAAVRAANGAAAPFDILPAVWISSAASVLVGVLAAKLLHRFSRE